MRSTSSTRRCRRGCRSPVTPFHSRPRTGVALTPSPEIVACVRRRSLGGSASWPPTATTRCQGISRRHRPHRVRTGPTDRQPDTDGRSTSRPAEWCTLRRRHRLSSRPDPPTGSTTGYGGRRQAVPPKDRRGVERVLAPPPVTEGTDDATRRPLRPSIGSAATPVTEDRMKTCVEPSEALGKEGRARKHWTRRCPMLLCLLDRDVLGKTL